MEDVLELYAEPYDPDYPVVCFDESPYQLISETRVPAPAKPGKPRRYDYEYKREGTCNLFMFFQPLGGWRHLISHPAAHGQGLGAVYERSGRCPFSRCGADQCGARQPEHSHASGLVRGVRASRGAADHQQVG